MRSQFLFNKIQQNKNVDLVNKNSFMKKILLLSTIVLFFTASSFASPQGNNHFKHHKHHKHMMKHGKNHKHTITHHHKEKKD